MKWMTGAALALVLFAAACNRGGQTFGSGSLRVWQSVRKPYAKLTDFTATKRADPCVF